VALGSEMWEDSGTKGNVVVEIALGEAIAAQLEFRRLDVGQVSIENAQRVELGEMMASDLISTNEELNLNAVRLVRVPKVS